LLAGTSNLAMALTTPAIACLTKLLRIKRKNQQANNKSKLMEGEYVHLLLKEGIKKDLLKLGLGASIQSAPQLGDPLPEQHGSHLLHLCIAQKGRKNTTLGTTEGQDKERELYLSLGRLAHELHQGRDHGRVLQILLVQCISGLKWFFFSSNFCPIAVHPRLVVVVCITSLHF